jgi:hypothetical protein
MKRWQSSCETEVTERNPAKLVLGRVLHNYLAIFSPQQFSLCLFLPIQFEHVWESFWRLQLADSCKTTIPAPKLANDHVKMDFNDR